MCGGSGGTVPVRLPGQEFARKDEIPQIDYQEIAPRFFETLRIPLIQGRDFNAGDHAGTAPVVILNEASRQSSGRKTKPLERR